MDYKNFKIPFDSFQKVSKMDDQSDDKGEDSIFSKAIEMSPNERSYQVQDPSYQNRKSKSSLMPTSNIHELIESMLPNSQEDLSILKTSDVIDLSDENAEFIVSFVKHILRDYCVFQVLHKMAFYTNFY